MEKDKPRVASSNQGFGYSMTDVQEKEQQVTVEEQVPEEGNCKMLHHSTLLLTQTTTWQFLRRHINSL